METPEALAISVVARRRDETIIFHLTMINDRPYQLVMQEAIGIGRRWLHSEEEVAFVDIYEGHALTSSLEKLILTLTRDDLPVGDEYGDSNEGEIDSPQEPRQPWYAAFTRWFRRPWQLFSREKHTHSIPEDAPTSSK